MIESGTHSNPSSENIFKNTSTSSFDEEHLTRIFNSAIVSSLIGTEENLSERLSELTQSPAFRVILQSIVQLANEKQIPEKDAAKEVIETFGQMSHIWGDYVSRIGVDRLRGKNP